MKFRFRKKKNEDEYFWNCIHPRVKGQSKSLFESENYAESVSTCLRDINGILKNYLTVRGFPELDGSRLIDRIFCGDNRLISFTSMESISDRNIHNGYVEIFKGMFLGVRNPKAHLNLSPDKNKTRHLLFICSFMFLKLEEIEII